MKRTLIIRDFDEIRNYLDAGDNDTFVVTIEDDNLTIRSLSIEEEIKTAIENIESEKIEDVVKDVFWGRDFDGTDFDVKFISEHSLVVVAYTQDGETYVKYIPYTGKEGGNK